MRNALTLAACLAATLAHANARPLDRGGVIFRYQQEIAAARGVHVISGDCMSACTLWLGYRGSCVAPDAVLWFHAASSGLAPSPIGTAMMADAYPPALRRLVVSRGWMDTQQLHALTAREVVALGVRACKS